MEPRSAKEIWDAALGELQIQVNKPNYRTWLEKTVGISYQGNQFLVGVPNTFAAEYLDKNQRSLIEKTLIGLTQRESEVIFRVYSQQKMAIDSGSPEAEPTATPINSLRFNPKYTFHSFVHVSSCNQLAYAAALEVADKLGRAYNPLFIYGGGGLGKTHLLHAIGHVAIANNMRVLFVSAEQFTNEFINAIQQRKTGEFRNKYRSVDVLLVDDLHFLSGKNQTVESFFHTFNSLHNANRQIAVTSDRPPKSLPLLQDRLRSRLEWGLVADIQPPDFETRLAILQAKAESKGVHLTLAVLEFIAEQGQRNIRELEGSLNRVIAYAKLVRVIPTPELAGRALADIAGKEPQKANLTASQIIDAVANFFQLTPQDLKSRKRDKETILARQVAMYLIKEANNCSLTQIGKELGDREPITVSQACRKISSEIVSNPNLSKKISTIQQEISLKTKSN